VSNLVARRMCLSSANSGLKFTYSPHVAQLAEVTEQDQKEKKLDEKRCRRNNTGNRQAAILDQRNESGPSYINKEVPSPTSERKNLLLALMSRNPFKCSYTWVAERKKK